ncbi:MAG: tetratricopeptide repeat protein [bacterium]
MRIFVKTIAILVLMASANICASGQESFQDIFNQANELYTKGDFVGAIKKYDEILSHEKGSFEVLYNLGNCYFKQNNIGKAVLFYERALKLKPRDSDTKFNLEFLRSSIITRKRELSFTDIIINWMLENVTANEATIALLIFYITFFVLLIFNLYFNNLTIVWGKIILLTVLLFVFLWWYGVFYRNVKQKYAIITTSSAQVKSGPGEAFTVGFTVPEGWKVIILKEYSDWLEIGVHAEGLRGWVKTEEVSVI